MAELRDSSHDEEELSTAELINRDSFERLKVKRKHRIISGRIFTVVISLLVTVFLLAICIYLFFGLKTVEIYGNRHYSPEDIRNTCRLSPKDNLVLISADKIRNALLDTFPYIEEVKVEKHFPGLLSITVTEQSPAYYTEIEGEWFLLSRNLRVLENFPNEQGVLALNLSILPLKLPPISYAVVGEPIGFVRASDYKFINDFLAELFTVDLIEGIDSIDAADRYHVNLYAGENRYLIKLGKCEDLPTKLRFVRRIIDEKCSLTTCAVINAEKSESVIMQKQSERFHPDMTA